MSVQAEVEKHYRHNFVVNLADGSFFGLAMGFASAVTILPLFIANFTDSTILISMIGSIPMLGSPLPQILTVGRVANLERYKSMAVRMTAHERLPFVGLVLLALVSPAMDAGLVVLLCYGLFIWHSLGTGFSSAAYQSMIGKIFPEQRRAMFMGTQMAGYSLLSGLGAVIAGVWLENLPSPYNYALCFFAATLALGVSWFYLTRAREPRHSVAEGGSTDRIPWAHLRQIWQGDANYRRFVLMRILAQFALVALSFLAIHVTRNLGMGEQSVGLLTGLLFFMQIAGALVGGWVGDRAGNRIVLMTGSALMAAAGVMAGLATSHALFVLIYALGGAGSAMLLINISAMTLEFGAPADRPYYISIANTLTAFAALVAPIFAGVIVEQIGYTSMFMMTALAGLATLGVLLLVNDPRRTRTTQA